MTFEVPNISPAPFLPGSDLAARVALAVAGLAGEVEVAVSMDVAGGAQQLVAAVHDRRDQALPLSGITRARIRELATGERVVRVLGATCASGLQVLTPNSEEWPASVDMLGRGAPLVLWARGDLSVFTRPSVGIVGPDTPSPYERHVALDLSTGLASRGWAVAVGQADGVEQLALRGAQAVEGRAFVLAHRGLEQLGERSLWVSEVPPLVRASGRRRLRAQSLRAAMTSKTIIIGAHHGDLPQVALGVHAMGLPVGHVVAEGLSTASSTSRSLAQLDRARAVSTLDDVEFL